MAQVRPVIVPLSLATRCAGLGFLELDCLHILQQARGLPCDLVGYK